MLDSLLHHLRVRKFYMLFVLVVCVAYPRIGHAQWEPEGAELQRAFQLEAPFSAFPATLRSALRIKSEKAPAARQDMDLQIAGLEGKLRVRTVGGATNQPWMIYLAAIFNGTNAPRVSHALNQYSQLGFRVMALPNPWSKQFIQAKPGHVPGSVKFEAPILLEAIDQVLEQFPKTEPAHIHIVGESYGAFLAAAVVALDSSRGNQRIGGSVTLLSPPVNLLHAMDHLDRLAQDTKERFRSGCSKSFGVAVKAIFTLGYAGLASVPRNFHRARSEDDLKPLSKACSAPLVAWYGFHAEMLKSAKAYVQVQHQKFPSEWNNALLFRDFYTKFAPSELAPENALHYDLANWIKRIPRPVRILTAKDDFLNEPDVWSSPDFAVDSVVVLPWGGHLGFQYVPAYETAMKGIFRNR